MTTSSYPWKPMPILQMNVQLYKKKENKEAVPFITVTREVDDGINVSAAKMIARKKKGQTWKKYTK